jgi:hypothetical protein
VNATALQPVKSPSSLDQRVWLLSRRSDFWLACGGASVALLGAVLVIFWHGDREIDALDFVLSEFHLGATYDAIIRRRLWHQRQSDVLLMPLVILALTYALSMNGQAVLLTSITMYAAVWHRGRQSLGVARFYQRQTGGAASPMHNLLFRGAIYLPMLAATLAYTHLAPKEYEGEPYLALSVGAEATSAVGFAAMCWVIAYLTWTLWPSREIRIHPGERWIVLAHAVAFGSGYILGASNASFLLVLAVHHEVQYLYFTYAMARRGERSFALTETPIGLTGKDFPSKISSVPRSEIKFLASFLLWPVIGFATATLGSWLQLQSLTPLGVGGLFCHYWLDGCIWTRQSFHN